MIATRRKSAKEAPKARMQGFIPPSRNLERATVDMEAGNFVENVQKLNEVLEHATPDLRIELLCRHEALHGVADELAARLTLNHGCCDEAMADDLNAAERRASELDSVSRHSRGGKKTAEVTAEVRSAVREKYAALARKLLAQGTNPRRIVEIVANRFHRDPTTIRRALKKTGVR